MEERHALLTASPEQAGIPSAAISGFIDRVEAEGVCMHAMIVLRQGKMVAEGYWKPFHKDRKHRLYSCSKSFVSLAIGFLADEGKISLDDRIVDYYRDKLPEGGVHPYMERATVRDLLMMASPHEKTSYRQLPMDDWIKSFFIVEPTHLPGTVFSYDTSGTHILGTLVERVSGLSFLDYLRPRLLDHLGFSEDAYCVSDPMGIAWGGSGVICTPRDFAKVALTCLQDGQYEGKQLIPQWYLKEATSRQIDNFATGGSVDQRQGYGYQFWRMRNNSFAFYGMGGQFALCVPDKDFILVTTADDQFMKDGDSVLINALWDCIYPHLSGTPLADDPMAHGALLERLSSLTMETAKGAFHSLAAGMVNDKSYRMDKNAMGFREVVFSFREDGGSLRFKKESGEFELAFGYGRQITQHFPEYDYECASSAAWSDDNTPNIACFIIDDCFAPLRITARFKDNSLTLLLRNVAELFLEDYMGAASGFWLD